LDDIINRLKKLKDKKAKKVSPLDDFFEPDEIGSTQPESESTETGLDIKPLGKQGQQEIPEEPQESAPAEEKLTGSEKDLAKGIRELSFDDLDESSEADTLQAAEEGTDRTGQQVIELSTNDPNKIKHLKLIVALLEADQFEAARQEIDNMMNP
jgi:hypothetical protein